MDVRVLDYFLRVIELGSINRGAAELGLSQPSLSRWLSLLEHEMGTPLLIRTRGGVRPTDAGEVLAERVRPILRQLYLLRDDVEDIAATQVALGMPPALQRLITVPFTERIFRDFPQVTLRIHEGINNAIRILMENGSVDLGVLVTTEPSPESFDMAPIVREQLMLVGPPAADLRPGVTVPKTRLKSVELILPGRPNMIRVQVERAVAETGGAYQRRIDAEALPLCVELVRRGLGFTVMPYSAIHENALIGADLVAAPIEDVDITWALCANRLRSHSVSVQRVSSALRNFIVARVEAGDWPHAKIVGDASPATG